MGIIKRDEHNMLDQDDADVVTKKVISELITTQRDYQKEIMFRNCNTEKRDIVVKIVLYRKNTVDGKIVKGDYQNPLFERLSDEPLDPIRYHYVEHIDCEINAKEMPMPMSKIGKWTMGSFKALINYLARMNAFDKT